MIISLLYPYSGGHDVLKLLGEFIPEICNYVLLTGNDTADVFDSTVSSI